MLPAIDTVSDDELARMTSRAWREASRSWAEYRAADTSIKAMLEMSAEMADAYWRDLTHEQARRLDVRAQLDDIAVEVISADRYTVNEQ
jgi:hypothetical protein